MPTGSQQLIADNDWFPLEAPSTCWVCGEPAYYADINFVAPVCGGICVWAAWEAMRLHDTRFRAW